MALDRLKGPVDKQLEPDPLTPSYATGAPTALQAPDPLTPTYTKAATDTFFDAPSLDQATTSAKGPVTTTTPTPQQPKGPAPTATPTGLGGPSNSDYERMLEELRQSTDPAVTAIQQDALARKIFKDLETAGHKVQWRGNRLVVDGREYVINSVSDLNTVPGPAGAQGGASAPNQYGATDEAYLREQIARVFAEYGRTPREDEYQQWLRYMQTPDVDGTGRALLGWDPYWESRLRMHATGDYYGNGTTPDAVGGGQLAARAAAGLGGPAPTTATGAANVEVGRGGSEWVQTANGGWVPPNHPDAAQATASRFAVDAPSYVPGDIDTLEGFDPLKDSTELDAATRAAIMQLLEGGGAVDGITEQAILALLANPHSLDQRTIDMMKAASREEAAALGAQEDEQLRAFGFANGLDDSRWLASERLASRRSADEAIIRGNREVELTAAERNRADELAAIDRGASYAQQKFGQKQAAVAASQSFLALESDNAFKTAALQGDRVALREQVNQKAAELGMRADELQLQYTLGIMDDLTRRYGIDVGASIDRAKLAQAGREFQEELIFRYTQLAQQDAQFGASLGLDATRLELDQRNKDRDRYEDF